MGYTRQTLFGISWTVALRAVMKFLGLIKVVVLARILNPQQFGLYGIANLVLGLLEIFTETGVNVFLVQEKQGIEEHLSSAWIVSMIRGVVIAFFIVLLSPTTAWFFHSPAVMPLLLVIAIIPLVRGFINPAVVIYQKELLFHKEFIFRSVLFSIDAVTAVSIGLLTHNVICIILGQLMSAFAEVLLSFMLFQHRPKFIVHTVHVKRIIHQGKWVTIAGIFNYLFHNFDDIVVGNMLNATQLGFYQMAYKFSMIPITEISDVVAKVTFPVYVKIVHDTKRLQRAFLKTILFVGICSFSLGGFIFIFAHEIIFLILGVKWLSIVPLIRLLLCFGIIQSISGMTATLFLAVKKQNYVSVVTFISFLGIAISIVPLVSMYGTTGAAFSALIGSLVPLPFMIYYSVKILR